MKFQFKWAKKNYVLYWISCDYVNNKSSDCQVEHSLSCDYGRTYTQIPTFSLSISTRLLLSFYLCASLYNASYHINVKFCLRVCTSSIACIHDTMFGIDNACTHILRTTIKVSVNHLDALIATVCLSRHGSEKSNT